MKNDYLLKEARERAKLAADADRFNREEALDDMRNIVGLQWPDDVRAKREEDNRPCLTINRLPQFLRQVTGDLRNMNPAIKAIPADTKASQEDAELVEGIIRQIQYESDASSIYERAAESAAACGMGFFRVLTDYVSNDSFDQKIIIQSIDNPFSVYFDPEARKSTREDARWCLITQVMTEEAFKDAYPDKVAVSVEQDGSGDGLEFWRQNGETVVAEYFWKEPKSKTIMLLPNGMILENAPKDLGGKTRTVNYDVIMWAKISGKDVLEGPQEFPGDHIPVIAVMGEELHIGDRIYRSSVIRFAKDPQRLYNYWRSAQTEMIALQPKAPYLVTAKQISGLEQIWSEANDSNRPYLPYIPDPNAPAPQRATPPIPSSGMMQEVGLAADDMKATTGIYDAGLGQRSDEKSGVAIRQRQMESDVSTSIYSDNMAKAVAHCGRVIVSMIPKIYDTNRMLATIGEDDQHGMTEINKPMMSENGPITINDMTKGKFDVRVAVGPNYATKRQETAESMMQFIQAFPPAAQVAGDLIAKSMDWPDADKIAERLKKMLPPGMAEIEDPEEQAMAQQQAMQAQQQQQQQQAMGQEAAMLQLRELNAKADKAEADAQTAHFNAQKAQLELAAMGGQLVPVNQITPVFPA